MVNGRQIRLDRYDQMFQKQLIAEHKGIQSQTSLYNQHISESIDSQPQLVDKEIKVKTASKIKPSKPSVFELEG